MMQPIANLPVTIFKFAMSPFAEWQQLAWAGVLIITLCVLLLNIPPDTRGLIHEADAKNLQEWKRLREATFADNRLKGAMMKSRNGKNARALLDGKKATYWTTNGKDSSAVIEFHLKSAQTVDVMLLQEAIQVGQRIEKFLVEYKDGKTWKKLAEGTTVGYKRLLRFPVVTAKDIRLTILSSRLNPTLVEVGLYNQAQ